MNLELIKMKPAKKYSNFYPVPKFSIFTHIQMCNFSVPCHPLQHTLTVCSAASMLPHALSMTCVTSFNIPQPLAEPLHEAGEQLQVLQTQYGNEDSQCKPPFHIFKGQHIGVYTAAEK
jgi:hypothetical protein